MAATVLNEAAWVPTLPPETADELDAVMTSAPGLRKYAWATPNSRLAEIARSHLESRHLDAAIARQFVGRDAFGRVRVSHVVTWRRPPATSRCVIL